MNLRKLLSLLAIGTLFALGACAGADSTKPGASQALSRVQGEFGTLQVLAFAYASLPPCESPRAPTLCASAAVVAQVDKAMTAAQVALDAARRTADVAGATDSTTATAIAGAVNALSALSAILAIYSTAG